MLPGRFAQTGPVLGHVVRAGSVAAHFAPAGAFADFARAVSLPAHFGRPGRVGAFAWAGQMQGHFPQPVSGHVAQPVRRSLEWAARPVPAYLSLPPKLGIA